MCASPSLFRHWVQTRVALSSHEGTRSHHSQRNIWQLLPTCCGESRGERKVLWCMCLVYLCGVSLFLICSDTIDHKSGTYRPKGEFEFDPMISARAWWLWARVDSGREMIEFTSDSIAGDTNTIHKHSDLIWLVWAKHSYILKHTYTAYGARHRTLVIVG